MANERKASKSDCDPNLQQLSNDGEKKNASGHLTRRSFITSLGAASLVATAAPLLAAEGVTADLEQKIKVPHSRRRAGRVEHQWAAASTDA
jgi:hypothetical protein